MYMFKWGKIFLRNQIEELDEETDDLEETVESTNFERLDQIERKQFVIQLHELEKMKNRRDDLRMILKEVSDNE
ncbi:hypothetical protein CYV19_12950 [Natronobacterium gregoryi SP2]|nr:hypothetical protein C490_03163 [Natronobacterium gregoryi SP2]PLK19811.1 hypothetical protein CYV19_12950 [Natronobacterium gregoryi SP2]